MKIANRNFYRIFEISLILVVCSLMLLDVKIGYVPDDISEEIAEYVKQGVDFDCFVTATKVMKNPVYRFLENCFSMNPLKENEIFHRLM